MIGLLRDLSDWVVGFADSSWAAVILGANSFVESIFFPVPPDPLLIAVALANPRHALWLAALVTVTSVAGAVVGHWLGGRFGRPLLQRMFSEDKVLTVERTFIKYGVWAVLIAALTPVPYKVFAIASGAFGLDLRTFVLASLVGRGIRFFTLGSLVFVFGDDIRTFIDSRFEVLTLAVGAVLVALVGLALIIARRRRTTDALR